VDVASISRKDGRSSYWRSGYETGNFSSEAAWQKELPLDATAALVEHLTELNSAGLRKRKARRVET
jgi:hypothetical protein